MKPTPLPPTLFLLAVAGMLGLHVLLPLGTIVPWPWRLLGAVPLAGGVLLNLWADRLFKRARTTVKPFDEPRALVVGGPFRFTRHPMYLGMTAALVGLWLLLGTIAPLLVVPPFAAVLGAVFIPVEERAMLKQFGEAYRAYRRRVRRWV
jgi:protein-S-isoprenylcysteine O-methyltransferase Ste14